jgi:hypothetical protein
MPRPSGRRRKRRRFTRRVKPGEQLELTSNGATVRVVREGNRVTVQFSGSNPKIVAVNE